MSIVEKEYEIQIEIENQCYLDCLHCSSLAMRNEPYNKIKNEELLQFLQMFNLPLHVYLSGGEPLAKVGIKALIRNIKNLSHKFRVGIFTCGVLSRNNSIDESYAKELKIAGLDDCYISLYHCDSEKHDLITNCDGSYAATIKSIRALQKQKIDVKVHLVITKFNYEELDRVIDTIFMLGISQVRLLRLVKTGSAELNWDIIGVSYEKLNMAIMRIISDIDKYYGKVTVSGFPKHTPCRPSPNAIKCQAGISLLYISSSKQVFPCACTKGNPSFLIGYINDTDKLKLYLDRQSAHLCHEECLNPTRLDS